MNNAGFIVVGLLTLAGADVALAGGYDTPMLYSARHMGMGGTAIGYVSDPSAIFHNPAGLSHTNKFALTVDFSPLWGNVTASPSVFRAPVPKAIESETTFAPFFLLAGSFRVTDWMTLGLGAYPVASAGATYKYESTTGNDIEDTTKVVFIELSPAISFEIPGNLKLGLGYRASLITFERSQVQTDTDTTVLGLELKGLNLLGFRAGLQWQPIPQLQVGLVYRHKTETEVTGDEITFINGKHKNGKMTFLLPSKLGFGVRSDLGPFGIALDVEYSFNSQNEDTTISAEGFADMPNQFRWKDAITFRSGLEYSFLGTFKARTGYIYDDTTSNKSYPTAFGTPPGPTHTVTLGAGFTPGPFEVNVAYAHRFGSATITQEDIDAGAEHDCGPCAGPGDYKIALHGAYVDFSYYW